MSIKHIKRPIVSIGLFISLILITSNAWAHEALTGFRWNRPVWQTGDNYDITYVLDTSDYTLDGPSAATISNSLISAFNSWQNVVTSDISFNQVADAGGNYDYWDNGWDWGEDPTTALPAADGGSTSAGPPPYYANIVFGGWLPSNYFEALRAGGGSTILGVNLSFGFIPNPGDPFVNISGTDYLDLDMDGFADFAFCEIYFNDAFDWAVGPGSYDIETVMLHELGHSIGLGHSEAAEAVMRSGYQGILRTLYPDDIAGVSYLYPETVIPEPATMILLGSLATGLFGVAAARKRR